MHYTGQRYVYSGDAESRVFIWDLLTGERIRVLRGHFGPVRDVSWHPYLPLIASSSWDTTVRLWDYREAHDLPQEQKSDDDSDGNDDHDSFRDDYDDEDDDDYDDDDLIDAIHAEGYERLEEAHEEEEGDEDDDDDDYDDVDYEEEVVSDEL